LKAIQCDAQTIDWEYLDIDEMDYFFDSIDYPGDECVDIDGDDEDLLRGFDREDAVGNTRPRG
jgi:hypothetical protein